MDIKLSKDEIFTAISEGVQRAFADAIWKDGFAAKWTDDMTDAITNGAYLAVYDAQQEKGDKQ